MTEQQLSEIEQRWASNEVTMQTINDFNLLLAEVRRLNQMVDKACAIIDGCPGFNTMDSSGNGNWFCGNKDCTRSKGQYTVCWRKYLQEGEAD